MAKINATCPECGFAVDDATSIADPDRHPVADDLAVCIQCAGLGIYVENEDGTLGLRLTTTDEKVELSQDPTLMELRAMIAEKSIWFTP